MVPGLGQGAVARRVDGLGDPPPGSLRGFNALNVP
jgi:hypothetical protein